MTVVDLFAQLAFRNKGPHSLEPQFNFQLIWEVRVVLLHLKLFKIAARITVSCRRIHLELASAYPYRESFQRACANLRAMPAG